MNFCRVFAFSSLATPFCGIPFGNCIINHSLTNIFLQISNRSASFQNNPKNLALTYMLDLHLGLNKSDKRDIGDI